MNSRIFILIIIYEFNFISFLCIISDYKKYVKRWFSVLMPKIVPFLYGNGGNIIMVQVSQNLKCMVIGILKKSTSFRLQFLHLRHISKNSELLLKNFLILCYNLFVMKFNHYFFVTSEKFRILIYDIL